ncbi:hypothetical protein BN903_344 [Halorubrum sp. AJ67]|nr:hypothetical protein BN903_344 [Halorubrum sp. AJ67]
MCSDDSRLLGRIVNPTKTGFVGGTVDSAEVTELTVGKQ